MDWSTLISNVTKNVMSKIVEVPSMTVCSSLNLESLQLLLNTTDVTDTITDDARVRYSRQLKLGRSIRYLLVCVGLNFKFLLKLFSWILG